MKNRIFNFFAKSNLVYVSIAIYTIILPIFYTVLYTASNIANNHNIELPKTTLTLSAIATFIFVSLLYVMRSANTIFENLRIYENEIRSTDNVEELKKIKNEFIKYVNDNVWHQHMHSRAREIYAEINTKLDTITRLAKA